MAERRRKPRNVTLNPLLVEKLLSIGKLSGEENLSRLLDDAMRLYIQHNGKDSPPPRKPGK